MTKIQLRRDTAANWSTNNPTPSAGEPCFETDTGKFKIGDGVTKYTNLPYQGGGGLEVCDIGMALYVDETKGLRRYLNGQIVDRNANTEAFFTRLQEITTLHPSLLCTEDEWQTAKTMSAFGQVGKFVFNYSGDEIVSVRIPRVVNVQGLFDLQNLGLTVTESLPNITGYMYLGVACYNLDNPTGVFHGTSISGAQRAASTPGAGDLTCRFNANKSSSTYQNGAPVQQEAIQYPYFIQIATGSETENNIVNEIELNNPYSLFDSKYSDHELNNLSWLKSEGQWNAKAVYPTAYDKLLKVYNGTETVEGLSVKLSTETYTDYDFVLNTADETFRLPLLDGSEDLLSDRYDNLTLGASGQSYIAPANGYFNLSKDGNTNQYIYMIVGFLSQLSRCTATGSEATIFAPIRKGDKCRISYTLTGNTNYFRFIYAQGNGSLYYYVGDTLQNANLIDAGRIGEILPTKTDMQQAAKASMPSDKYIDLELGASGTEYIAPANGYFQLTKTTGAEPQLISLWNNSANNLGIRVLGPRDTNAACFIPVKENDICTVTYDAAGKTQTFRFIYAVGSEPTA